MAKEGSEEKQKKDNWLSVCQCCGEKYQLQTIMYICPSKNEEGERNGLCAVCNTDYRKATGFAGLCYLEDMKEPRNEDGTESQIYREAHKKIMNLKARPAELQRKAMSGNDIDKMKRNGKLEELGIDRKLWYGLGYLCHKANNSKEYSDLENAEIVAK